MLRLVFLLFLTAGCYYFGYAQPDFKSSGRCLSFDGVDDYLNLGDILDDLTLPLTVEAWVYVDGAPAYALPVFSSQDNLPLYNGVDFAVTSTRITGGYGDGRGENSGQYRRAKSQTIPSIANKWTHVAMVIKGPVDMQLFVNGIDVGGGYDGATNLPISSNSPGDVAKVGQWSPNGDKYFFKGKMDEVRVWNVGLTADQIRTNMCQKLKGNEAGLVGNWSFNETSGTAITDRSPRNHAAGKMLGNPTRVYSGAPLGDNSTYLYGSSWTATSSLASLQGDESLRVGNITGNPEGIHIYYVSEHPSQTGNLDLSTTPQGYFGVFAGGYTGTAYSYTATYSFKNAAPCSIARRRDNSVATWTPAAGAVTTSAAPVEIIRTGIPRSPIELGADKSTCNTSPVALAITGADASATYLWSTGQTSANINVSATGKYWVSVTDVCGTARDTVQVSFLTTPTAALGADRVSCTTSVMLNPVANATGSTFLWQDGSTAPQLEVRNSGSYWVRVSNACGASRDTVQLTFPGTPQATLGVDRSLCATSTVLTPVSNAAGLTFQWQDGTTSSQLVARSSGVYSVRVSNVCRSATASVNLTFLKAPAGISLGMDQAVCNASTVLAPVTNPTGLTFEWQDGSTAPQLEAQATGTYWVNVRNACGMDRDTIQLTFPGTPGATLGVDRTLCDISTRLTPVDDPTGLAFEWQDGSTAPQFDAYGTGVYWVRVSNVCKTVTDSVRLEFTTAPMGVSLGDDKALCNIATVLTPVADPEGLTFEWQDGSTEPQLVAKAPGIYWVVVSNACGFAYDTMAITKKIYSIPLPPNVITPNGDDKNESFILPIEPAVGAVKLAIFNRWGQQVYLSDDYKNNWTGSGLAAGVYYYQAGGGCFEKIKGVINILR